MFSNHPLLQLLSERENLLLSSDFCRYFSYSSCKNNNRLRWLKSTFGVLWVLQTSYISTNLWHWQTVWNRDPAEDDPPPQCWSPFNDWQMTDGPSQTCCLSLVLDGGKNRKQKKREGLQQWQCQREIFHMRVQNVRGFLMIHFMALIWMFPSNSNDVASPQRCSNERREN